MGLSAVLLVLALQAARLASAMETPSQDLTFRVGDKATFSLDILQMFNDSNLLWRSSSRGSMEAVAAWKAGNPLEVLSRHYSRRVTFQESSWALEIHNLSQADGGFYQVVHLQDPSEVMLKKYTLVVFQISSKATMSANGTCSLSLLCEAGAGAKAQVKYSWGPGQKGPELHLNLHPADKDKSYTCTASALGTQHFLRVTPYEACSSASRAAGLLGPFLLALLLQLLFW
ncbi:uncharacterized protein LOC132588940 [Heteronotia binoei]|uniref:uncharacterized protein LOC132588940 n=1 Tax=Heteronotia binoei TaxID=13085 RepID=UPI00292EBE0E|nr:uncharacterized protein LOC132588940 [Heteronotia binoei]